MTAAAEPVDQLATALAATGQLLAGVRADQWSAPTPCPDWSVRDLVAHVVAGNRAFAAILRGEQPPPSLAPGAASVPGTGETDLLAAYREQAPALLAAFRRPGVLDTLCTVPAGTVPGIVAVHLRITELLVHGWDLAQATGQDTTPLPADLAEQELAFTRRALPDLPPGRRPFAPPQPVSDAAPAIDRLAACLGRPVAARVAGGDA